MPLRPFIFENLWLKVFSLILATLIWFAIQSNQLPQNLFSPRAQELRCPVNVMVPPGNPTAFKVEPGVVLVKLRADEAVLKKLSSETIHAYVTITDAPSLNHLFRVQVIVPRDVTLKEVVPNEVSVKAADSGAQ